MTTQQPIAGQDYYEEDQDDGHVTINDIYNVLCHTGYLTVLDRDLNSPPAAVDGDAYLVASGATGAWTGHDNQVAMHYAGWIFRNLQPGEVFTVQDEKKVMVNDSGTLDTVYSY